MKWLNPSPLTPGEKALEIFPVLTGAWCAQPPAQGSSAPKGSAILAALFHWEPESITGKIAISFSGFLEGPQKRQNVFEPLPTLRSVLSEHKASASERAADYSGI